MAFQNYDFKYRNGSGKPVFVPTNRCKDIGYAIKEKVEAAHAFADFYYHLKPGGHIAALRSHRPNQYFARIDIQRFFYSVSRNQVARALRSIGVRPAGHLAKWSCVKNPYLSPSYSLPYGFVQSPVLATLTLDCSAIGLTLRNLADCITVAVYMDDITISGESYEEIQAAYDAIRAALTIVHFPINETKTHGSRLETLVFNCDLSVGKVVVSEARRAEYYAELHSPMSEQAFARYCADVEAGNF